MLGFAGPDYDLQPHQNAIARHDSRDGLAYAGVPISPLNTGAGFQMPSV